MKDISPIDFTAHSQIKPVSPVIKSGGFSEVVEKLKTVIQGDSNALEKMTNSLSTKVMSPQELLKLQIQVHQIGTKVEMVGKIAEGGNSIVRRLQGGN